MTFKEPLAKAVPLYRKLYDDIRSRIVTGAYAPGQLLPGEDEISEMFGVSKTTTRRALHDLALERLVERLPGIGTRVLASNRTQAAHLDRGYVFESNLEGFLENHVIHVLSLQYEILDFESGPLPDAVCKELRLPMASEGLRVVSIAKRDGKRAYYVATYAAEPHASRIREEDKSTTSCLILLMQKGLRIGSVDQALKAINAPADVVADLDIEATTPVMRSLLTVFDITGAGAAYIESYLRGDEFEYFAHLSRGNAKPQYL